MNAFVLSYSICHNLLQSIKIRIQLLRHGSMVLRIGLSWVDRLRLTLMRSHQTDLRAVSVSDECPVSPRTTLGERSAHLPQAAARDQGLVTQGTLAQGNRYCAVDQVSKGDALTCDSQLRRHRYPPAGEEKCQLGNHQTSPGRKPTWLPLLERTERCGFK
jgi:hypothetical protein